MSGDGRHICDSDVITSFSVGAELVAEDRISPVLLNLAKRFEEIDRLITRLNERMATLGAAFGGEMTAKADAMSTGVTAALGRVDAALGATSARVKALGDELAGVRRRRTDSCRRPAYRHKRAAAGRQGNRRGRGRRGGESGKGRGCGAWLGGCGQRCRLESRRPR